MKLKTNVLIDLLILIPLIFLYIGEIVGYIYPSTSSLIKLTSFILLVFPPFYKKICLPSKLLVSIFFFVLILIVNFFNSFNYLAAIEAGLRYLFPFSLLIYGFYHKKKLNLFINFIIVLALLNFIYQITNYVDYYILDVNKKWNYLSQYSENSNSYIYWAPKVNGFLRASGFIVSFVAYGILSFIAYWLTYYYYFGKYRKELLLIFLVNVFLSTSFKAIFVFLLTLFIKFWSKIKYAAVLIVLLPLGFLVIGKDARVSLMETIKTRLSLYITEGDSARSESYRVMFEELGSFNLFGEGLGTFGGPASIKYNSPFYNKVNFNWYGLEGRLTTTDTFFPHLFVELGLIGGLVYLTILLIPLLLQKKIKKRTLIALCLIYGVLLFDSLFSFSINNLLILSMTLLLIYPLIYNIDKVTNYNFKSNI